MALSYVRGLLLRSTFAATAPRSAVAELESLAVSSRISINHLYLTMNKIRAVLIFSVWSLTMIARAQVADAFYQVLVSAGTEAGNGAGSNGATPRNVAIDRAVHVFFPGDEINPPFGYDLEQRAHAEAYGGESPQAIATAEARVTFSTGQESPPAVASANALVNYFLHLDTTNTSGLVWHPALIPVQFHALAEVTGASSASVGVLNVNTGVGLFSDSAAGPQHPSPRPGFDRTVAFSIAPTHYLRVALSANASAYDDAIPATADAESSQALADPTFAFDQTAFDLYAASLGQPTFHLADFYSFEFSPTVVVPEPGSAMLLWCGATFCLCRRTLRTQGRNG